MAEKIMKTLIVLMIFFGLITLLHFLGCWVAILGGVLALIIAGIWGII